MSNALTMRPGKGRAAGPRRTAKPVTLAAGVKDTGPEAAPGGQLLDYAAQFGDHQGDQPHAEPGPAHVRARIQQARDRRGAALGDRFRALFPH